MFSPWSTDLHLAGEAKANANKHFFKMPRKKISEDQLKTKQLNIWLSISDYKTLYEQADAAGKSLNNWIREYLFSKQFPAVKMTVDKRDAILELNKIGNNLNQLTRLANAEKQIPLDLIQVIEAVQNKIQNLKNVIFNDCEAD